jgi:3-methyladenine DNA glycosylase Mpg
MPVYWPNKFYSALMKLNLAFYQREDVVEVAKDLLGKCLFTRFDNKVTAGIITETEAYAEPAIGHHMLLGAGALHELK